MGWFMKRRILSVVLVLTVAVTMVLGSGVSVWGGIEQVKTPTAGATKWAVKPGGSMTPPTLYQERLYVAAGKYVYIINKDNGAVVKKSVQLAGPLGYTTVPVTCADGKVFVPITGGKVDILDASSLTRIRTTEGADSGQTITPVVYQDGFLYTGTYRPSGEKGSYICIEAATGKIKWRQENPHGFYWAGACKVNQTMIFGSEDGQADGRNGDATLYAWNTAAGKQTDALSLPGSGDIRSTIVYDEKTGCVCFTSKAGRFYKVKLNGDGTFSRDENFPVDLGGASTSTPVIYNGKAYVGVNGTGTLAGKGMVKRIDLAALKVDGTAVTPGYIQGEMLLSTGNGTPYLYGACNYLPGGICMINVSSMAASSFFTPNSAQQQYGLSRVICDSRGTLYYTNDSNYLMAVSSPVRITSSAGKGGKITASQTVGSGAPSCSFTAAPNKYYYVSSLTVDGRNQGSKTSYTFYNVTSNHTIKAAFKKVAVPTKVKAAAGKKKATIRWKRASGVNGYQVYRASKKKGKYKKVKTITRAKTTKYINKKLKKNKKYYYKIRAYKKVNGKTVYGAFSKTVKVKAK